MKILITGGAGFIGSNLGGYLLQKGHDVHLLDNLKFGYRENLIHSDGTPLPASRLLKMDIRDNKITRVFKDVDILFHFAAISSLPECQNNPQEAYSVNVAGMANILEAARRHNIKRIIFSSTAGVYENEKTFPTPEDITIHPSLIYSLTKKNAEELCQSYQLLYGMDIVTLRFFNVYGPHMDSKRANPPVISYIIKCLLERRQPILHADGNQKRDMIYIDDVVRLCELVLMDKKAKNQTFNVGSGKIYSINEIYKKISTLLQSEKITPKFHPAHSLWNTYPSLFEGAYPFQTKYLEKEVNKYTEASINKANALLGWKPKINVDEGLQKTILHAQKSHSVGRQMSMVSKK